MQFLKDKWAQGNTPLFGEARISDPNQRNSADIGSAHETGENGAGTGR
ncbi:hypothetical protein [Verminephrobacter eiseniae]|nr:hypothetical protein [Verminephrobacter eiseniae]